MSDLPARRARVASTPLLAMASLLPVVAAAGDSSGAASWQALLERPVSPGSVALLVEHATEPAVLARWAEALRDGRPEVRAAAARVANVTASTSLLPELLKALATETDGEAAGEELAAVAALGGPARDADLLAVARKEPRFAADVAAALGRARGRSALDHLPSLRALSLTSAQLGRFLDLATAGAEGLEPAASAALRERDAVAWAAVLQTARSQHVPLSDGVLISSLGSSSSHVRAATYWHLQLASGWQPSPVLRQALDASPEATAAPGAPRDDLGAGFAFELLQRMYRRPPREDAAWIASVREGGPVAVDAAVLSDKDVLRRFTPSELSTLSARMAGGPDALDAWLKEKPPPDLAANRGRAPHLDPSFLPIQRAVAMHTPHYFPRGFVSDVLGVSGCRGGENQFGGGRVTYARDGRPREVAFLKDTPGPCADAVRALVLSSLVNDRLPRPDQPELVIVPLSAEPEGCAEPPGGSPARAPTPPALHVGGTIREPKKIRNVAPVYPESARQERVQGVVVLRTIIALSGCVEAVEVVQGTDPRLDVAALVAVSRWRYTPTLLDGRPVPVIMTVTVNFRLS